MNPEKRFSILQSLDELTHAVPFTASRTCHLLFDLVTTFTEPEVIEVSCCYGKATVYLAAAVKETGGFLRGVDHLELSWNGRTAEDLLRQAALLDVCEMSFGCDAHWYLLDLFSRRPGTWIDVAYFDMAHTIEGDAFAALSLWTHLQPGGLLVFDDLDWIPGVDGNPDAIYSRPTISHVRALYDYICRLPSVRDHAEWGSDELNWSWGFIMKEGRNTADEPPLVTLLERFGTSEGQMK